LGASFAERRRELVKKGLPREHEEGATRTGNSPTQ